MAGTATTTHIATMSSPSSSSSPSTSSNDSNVSNSDGIDVPRSRARSIGSFGRDTDGTATVGSWVPSSADASASSSLSANRLGRTATMLAALETKRITIHNASAAYAKSPFARRLREAVLQARHDALRHGRELRDRLRRMTQEAAAEAAGDPHSHHPAYQTVKDLWHQFRVLWTEIQAVWDDSLSSTEGEEDRCPNLVENEEDLMMSATPSHASHSDSPLSNVINEPAMDDTSTSSTQRPTHPVAIHTRVPRTDLGLPRSGMMPASAPHRARAGSRSGGGGGGGGYRYDDDDNKATRDRDTSGPGDVELPLIHQPRVLSTMDENDIKRMRLEHVRNEVGHVAELMNDMAALVDHQGKQLDAIEANLEESKTKTLAGEDQLRQAARAQPVRKSPAIVLGVIGAAAGTFFAGPLGLVLGPKIALGVTALMGGGMAASGGYAVTKAIQKRGIDDAPITPTPAASSSSSSPAAVGSFASSSLNKGKTSPSLPSPATPPVTSAPMAASPAVSLPATATGAPPAAAAATSAGSWWPWRRAGTAAATASPTAPTSTSNVDDMSDSSSDDENDTTPAVGGNYDTPEAGVPPLRASTTETSPISPRTGMRRASVGRDRRPSRRSRRVISSNNLAGAAAAAAPAGSSPSDVRHKAFPGWKQ